MVPFTQPLCRKQCGAQAWAVTAKSCRIFKERPSGREFQPWKHFIPREIAREVCCKVLWLSQHISAVEENVPLALFSCSASATAMKFCKTLPALPGANGLFKEQEDSQCQRVFAVGLVGVWGGWGSKGSCSFMKATVLCQLLPEPWAHWGRGWIHSCPHSTYGHCFKNAPSGDHCGGGGGIGKFGCSALDSQPATHFRWGEKEGSLTPETNIDQDKINLPSERTENIVFFETGPVCLIECFFVKKFSMCWHQSHKEIKGISPAPFKPKTRAGLAVPLSRTWVLAVLLRNINGEGQLILFFLC